MGESTSSIAGLSIAGTAGRTSCWKAHHPESAELGSAAGRVAEHAPAPHAASNTTTLAELIPAGGLPVDSDVAMSLSIVSDGPGRCVLQENERSLYWRGAAGGTARDVESAARPFADSMWESRP